MKNITIIAINQIGAFIASNPAQIAKLPIKAKTMDMVALAVSDMNKL